MENMDKGITVPKWVLILRPKIPGLPQKFRPIFSAQGKKFRIFETKKTSLWISIVRGISYCTSAYALWEQQSIDTTMYAF